MTTRVYIDHNIWDFAYDNQLDLTNYFPRNEFVLAITKHGRFELEQMPNTGQLELKRAFIESALGNDDVQEMSSFGFRDPSHTPDEQRPSGFGMGELTTNAISQERQRLNAMHGGRGKRKPEMILTREEADIELGALSMEHYVISLDKKNGPLRSAKNNGGKVIFLNELSQIPSPHTLQLAANTIRSMGLSR